LTNSGSDRSQLAKIAAQVKGVLQANHLDAVADPYRQGLLPSVRVFIDHLAAEFPKAVMIST
jgi:hypothetical protein